MTCSRWKYGRIGRTARREVIERFAPVLYLHPRDRYRPGCVEDYLEGVCLRLDRKHTRDKPVLDRVNCATRLLGHYVDRQHSDRSYPSRYFLEVAGNRTQRETTRRGNLDRARCYAHMRHAPGSISRWDIQYLFFYPFNGRLGAGGAHEGDWEHITVRVNHYADRIEKVYFSAHHHEGRWSYERSALNPAGYAVGATCGHDGNQHVRVWVAKHSHACYPEPGRHPRHAFMLPHGGLHDTIGDLLPDDTAAESEPAATTWDCAGCLEDLTEHTQPWLRYSGLWGEVGQMFSGPYGPAHQPWWYDDDAARLPFPSAIQFLSRNNCCSDVIYETTDDAGQYLTDTLRRDFEAAGVRSLLCRNVRRGVTIRMYDHPDPGSAGDRAVIRIKRPVDYLYIDHLEPDGSDARTVIRENDVFRTELTRVNGLAGRLAGVYID